MPLDGTGYERRIYALEKIDQVIDLLRDERRWSKRRLHTPDDRHCILGAIEIVGGESALTEPILLAVRQISGRQYRHIEAFNDAPETSHMLVTSVLRQARTNILTGATRTNPEQKPWIRLRRFLSWRLGRRLFGFLASQNFQGVDGSVRANL